MSVASRAPAPRDDAKGYLVIPIPPTPFGKYTVIGKLGHGGMAEVNLAVVGGKGGFRKLFVVKRLHAHLEAEPGFVDMFLDEARLAAQLDHPNCVQTVEVGEAEGMSPSGARVPQHFLAMEFLDGQGLERLLRITGQRGDILPVTTSARMIADALDGLGYAHELRGYDGTPLGVVHRDVSPQNIFVTYAGVVKLLDFGIAKAESNVVETRTGVVKGKYAYIAPEQALAAPVDRRADLWSMGVVLWEMLTSRRLFKSVNELATLNETLRGEIHPPSKYNPAVPRELDAVVLRALQRDVDQRYSSANEFKEALESWLATQPDASDRKAIAALMKERFGDIIEQHKERLKECIASVAQDPRSLDRLVLGSLASNSSSMESDALQSGSHPPIPVGASSQRPITLSPPSLTPAPHLTPTPSPRPRLGLSVSGSITSGMASMDEIAPRASHPSSSGHLAIPHSSSGAIPMTSSHPGMPSPNMSTSSEWIAPSNPGFAVPPAGVSGPFGADQTMRVPARRDRTRSFGWWLIGLAACVVSAVVAIVTWSAMQGSPGGSTDGSLPTAGAGGTPTQTPATPPVSVATAGVGSAEVGSAGSAPSAQPSTAPSAPPGSTGGQAEASSPGSGESGLALVEPVTETMPAPGAPGPRRRGSRGERAERGGPIATSTPLPTPTATPSPPEPPPAAPEPAARGQGYLSLRTSPWTEVTLEGRALGETPLVRVALPPGTHTLRLRNREANIDETYSVNIRPGETTSQTLGLR